VIEAVTKELLAARNSDGGWGTFAERPTNTEATAFALMGLAAGGQSPVADEQGLSKLLAMQNTSGAWPMLEATPDNPAATALALIALSGFADTSVPIERGAAWLVAQTGDRGSRGRRLLQRWLPELMPVESRLDLQGWPWVAGTWSWVEPTAYAVFALKRAAHIGHSSPEAAARIKEGERLLYDRMCYGGGWNYGNKKVLGQELLPYPDETALALLALSDRSGNSAVIASLQVLELLSRQNGSGLTSSLAAICLSRYDRDSSEAQAGIRTSHARTAFLADNKVRGLALLALGKHHSWTDFGG